MSGQLVLVLGAGLGRRMGGPKLFLRHQGRGFLQRIVSHCAASGSPWVLVYPQGMGRRIQELLRALENAAPPLALVEGDGQQPMLASVQSGLRAARAAGAFSAPGEWLGCWVWPVDAPGISPRGWLLATEAVQEQSVSILKLQTDGKTGHPIWFPAWAIDVIVNGEWADGLLGFLASEKEQTRTLELSGETLRDFNTPEDLEKWRPTPGDDEG